MNLRVCMESVLPAAEIELLGRLGGLADENGERLCLVGGAVRDIIMQAGYPDIDLVIEGDAFRFARNTAAVLGLECVCHEAFGTATISSSGTGARIDIAAARHEKYARPGALPTVMPGTIESDLNRRDFSVNAMAISLLPDDFGELIDPFGGYTDIESKLLHALHGKSFVDDPTRILRGMRFKGRLDFDFEESTEQCIRKALDRRVFSTISGARIKKELRLIFGEWTRGRILSVCREYGVGAAICHGFEFNSDLFFPGDAVREAWETLFQSEGAGEEENWIAGLAASAMDSDPKIIAALAERIDATRGETDILVSAAAARRPEFVDKLGDPCASAADIGALLDGLSPETLICLYAAGDEISRVNITMYLRVTTHVRLQITGDDLIGRGYKPSQKFSEVLKEVLRRKRDGFINNADEELETAMQLLGSPD